MGRTGRDGGGGAAPDSVNLVNLPNADVPHAEYCVFRLRDAEGSRTNAAAVEAEIEGGGIGELGFDDAAFVLGDLAPERLGMAFHRLRSDGEAGQFAQQGAGAVEAGPGRGDADHA